MTLKSYKKLIMFVLIFVVFLSVFTGCAEKSSENTNESDNSVNSPDDGSADNSENPSTETTKYTADYLPDKTYDGYEFRIVVPISEAYDAITTAHVEEESGDTVNDAIYKRNITIEEKYGINFNQIDVPDYPSLTSTFNKSTAAASDDFDLCMLISRDAWATALTGAIVPVDKLPYLDISQPWYSHDVNSEITINGKLYFAYSDECMTMFEYTTSIMFNKKLVEDLALDNMYNLVKDGKWTIDKFFALSKAAVLDVDGNDEMTDTDRYGILSQKDMLYPSFWVSSGIKTVSKDAGDLLVFTGDNEKLYTVLNKVYQNIFEGEKILFDAFRDKITTYQHQGGDDTRKVSRMQFENNLGLFFIQFIGSIPTLRSMETDFGILPFPKYDESQEKYQSRVIDGWINCVPVTSTDLERTSIIMEALAVESKNITVPAYFETALHTKYARDNESQEMLEIIHSNRTMDLGDVFYMDAVRNIYMGVFDASKNDFASAVEKKVSAVTTTLQKANDAANALE